MLEKGEALLQHVAVKIAKFFLFRQPLVFDFCRDGITCRAPWNAAHPHPGMLLDLMKELGYPPEDTYMIGDSKKDRKAAANAGVRFIEAKDFFKY